MQTVPWFLYQGPWYRLHGPGGHRAMLSWAQNRVHPLLKAVQGDCTDGEFLALIPRPVGFSDGG